MTKNAQLVAAGLFWLAVVGGIALVAYRASRGFSAYLDAQGFEKQRACPGRIFVREVELRDATCWRGPLAPRVTGDLVTGYIPSMARRGYRYFLGVIVEPAPGIDDAWLERWPEQDASRMADGRYVVLWNLVDSRDNAARVLAQVRASLPP